MAADSFIHGTRERRARGRVSRNGLLQLGWPHYWLLSSILGGMLALVGLVFFLSYSSF